MKKINLFFKAFCLIINYFLLIGNVHAQNYSGLLNKKLARIDDVGALIESQLGSLFGGKIKGTVDSVLVNYDGEKTLKVKLYYSGFTAGFFNISTLGVSKQKQNEIVSIKFSQLEKGSPAECILLLNDKIEKGTKLESSFLRIDVGKKENASGSVNVFSLSKNWKNELDPQNVVVAINLQPVGKAASLSNTEAKDVLPGKSIYFDPKILYYQKPVRTITPRSPIMRAGGLNALKLNFNTLIFNNVLEDISGTWINTDADTRGITKLVIANNNNIHGYGKCSPEDCDWGATALADMGSNNFKAIFEWSFQTATLAINYAGNQLTVNQTTVRKNGGGTASYTYTFRKNIAMVARIATIYTLKQAAAIKINTEGQVVSKVPQGPNKNKQIYLLDGLAADVDFKTPQDISNININVFGDKNENSGVYYILPADYHLKWETKTEPEKGFEFRILYGSQKTGEGTETTTDAPVRMSATLTAGISSRERSFVRSLLKAYFTDFTELRFLPLKENPQFTFQNTLGAQYNIPQSKITVETNTDLTSDIHVAWQTDADTKEFIQTALTAREGIAASVILKPDVEDILDQQIPAIINLADRRTIGKIMIEPNVWRTRNWRNTTPYPLKLRYLHVLKKETNGKTPIIYSWAMNDEIVPSQAQVTFNNTKVPAWLDNDPSAVMWIDYSIEMCSNCDQKVMDAVTGGVSGAKTQQVKFTIAPAVFDSLHAAYFNITVRTRQVDPKGEEVKELPTLKITKDAIKDFTVGPLFIPTGGNVEFEYKITMASIDGDFYPTNEWIKASDKEVLLGKTKMKEIFKGLVPGIN